MDGMTIADVRSYLRERWPTIRSQLLGGTYRPQPVRRVEIPRNHIALTRTHASWRSSVHFGSFFAFRSLAVAPGSARLVDIKFYKKFSVKIRAIVKSKQPIKIIIWVFDLRKSKLS